MLVLAGVTQIDTESKGGGFGVGIGLGSGQSGVGVNYQGIDLSTTGTHSVAMAIEYSPPTPPDEYANKEHWIKECYSNLKDSAKIIMKMDEFAQNADKIKPGIFNMFSSDSSLSVHKDNFDKAYNHLLQFQEYERKKTIWNQTRVCNRCGESFVPTEGLKEVEYSFVLPEYSFDGKDRCCPCCKSHQWKSAENFFSIPIRELENSIETYQRMLKDSIEYYSQPPRKGFWGWFNKPLIEPLTPDKINSNIVKEKMELANAIDKRNQALEINGSFSNMRVCINCKAMYFLDSGRPVKVESTKMQ